MTERWFYSPGNHYVLDDLSGFKIRRDKARLIPGGQTGHALVARTRWEPQQPQDFVRGVVDDQTVDIARPRQENQFMVVGTFVTQAAQRGSETIVVDSTAGMTVGDTLQIMLDSGVNFTAQITAISGMALALSAPLPDSVGTLGDPAQNMVLDLTAPKAPLNWMEPGAA